MSLCRLVYILLHNCAVSYASYNLSQLLPQLVPILHVKDPPDKTVDRLTSSTVTVLRLKLTCLSIVEMCVHTHTSYIALSHHTSTITT
jgi:hypothetical protein